MVLVHGMFTTAAASWVVSPLQGSVVEVRVSVGDVIQTDSEVAVVLSMKMEHLIQWAPGELSSGNSNGAILSPRVILSL